MTFERDRLAEVFNGVCPVFCSRYAARFYRFFTGEIAYVYTGEI